MPFIDTHVHFWDRATLDYSWLDPLTTINDVHVPATLHEEAGTDLPAKIVFVQAGSNSAQGLAEAQWVASLAATEPRLAGIVAFAPMDAGATTTQGIADLKNVTLVRGVRHNVEHMAEFAAIASTTFAAGVRELGARGLSFDHCCKHHQLAATIALVRACPHTQFILDHAGKPDIRAGLLDPWREHISTLARLPNVVCKFSGLVTEADHADWQPADLRPYVDHLLQAFGPSRLLFGSDWPVVKLASPYLRWLHLAREFTADLTAAEQQAIFHDNAVRIYRLG